MCGISCFIGTSKNATRIVIDGLAMLEHRGYDSIGLTRLTKDGAESYKISQAEKKDFSTKDLRDLIVDLEKPCSIAIGHNRWATFGGVTCANAHPHHDEEKKFFLVQNGNVENLAAVEKEIGKWQRYSETDTEAIVNLVAKYFREGNSFVESVQKTINFIEGANALVVMKIDEPDKLVVANKGGSIILGQNQDGVFIVSDISAFDNHSINQQKVLLDNEIAQVGAGAWQIIGSKKNQESNDEHSASRKTDNNFAHFMAEEIFAQPNTFLNTLRGRLVHATGNTHLDCATDLARELRKAETFHFVGCGTAYNACQYASLLFNRFGMTARAWVASEFVCAHPVFHANDVFIFVSQSGETADTLEVIKEIEIKGNIRLGIVNVPGSRIWRDTQAGIGIRAGKERGVASTKAYTSQLASIAILAIFLARQRQMTIDGGQKILKELEALPSKIEEILQGADYIKQLVKKYAKYKNYFFLGRYFNAITAFEGSLKLKEVSYIHSEAYPLGEMKHGPLALVDEKFCSVVIAPNDAVFKKSLVNIHEIKSRNGQVLAIANRSADIEIADDILYIPETIDFLSPILSVIPLQLFSYFMALELGKNPDKPRNLAKTVTVN